MIVTARINLIKLDSGASLFFDGENVFVPFGRCTAKALPDTLESLGADTVIAEYNTISDPKAREQDRMKYSRRLTSLAPAWVVGEWQNKVVDGHTFDNVMQCTIQRTQES